jgi:iron complex transport system ATP-binding protein
MAELIVTDMTLAEGGVTLVDGASFSLAGGELVVVIGENGAGKSSLLRGIIGYRPLSGGTVAVDGQSVAAMTATERARAIGWLPQSVPLAWPIRVRDAVALGRFGHGGVPGKMSGADSAIVERALTQCDLLAFADRSTATLSGGELARVHLARCIATQAPLLLADEPVAALDPRHQIAVMEMLKANARAGAGVLVVLHDLALAGRFADRVIGMKGGRIVAEGSVADVMAPDQLERLFGIAFAVDATRGWPQPLALG